MQFRLRQYQDDDFDQLWSIDQGCFPPGIAYSKAELMHYIRRRRAFTIVAEINNSIGGFIVGESLRTRGHLITLDVREEFRRNGIGSELMAAAEKGLVNKGCEVVFLETAVNNTPAIAFYKRHGYVVLKTIPRYYEDKLDALLMGKRLKSESGSI